MPEFWQFPTVSMGLGPDDGDLPGALHALSRAPRDLADTQDRKVWCFLGDGEMDEPESLGAITMPVREKLDNLIFVINCNLQRLDGPVRGNGKIIQELEAAFRGAGWNVIKVIWGSRWDPLLARDKNGLLAAMEECVDGEYQTSRRRAGRTRASTSSARTPSCKAMVAHLSDEDIWRLIAAATIREGFRRVSRGGASQGPADRDPCEDGQGLRHGRGGRRPEHHAPAEEARRRELKISATVSRADLRRGDREPPVLQADRRQRGDEIPARAARRARRLICRTRRRAPNRSQVPERDFFKS